MKTHGRHRYVREGVGALAALLLAATAQGGDITFSDPAGQRNVARLHWARNGAAMVYDLPAEARLEPETWGWGVLSR